MNRSRTDPVTPPRPFRAGERRRGLAAVVSGGPTGSEEAEPPTVASGDLPRTPLRDSRPTGRRKWQRRPGKGGWCWLLAPAHVASGRTAEMTDPATHQDRYQESSDIELIRLYRSHDDHDAITTVIRRHDAALRGMVRRVLHHDEDAADVVQSTWVRALTALARPDYEVHGIVRGWLWSIARHEAIDRLRRARVRPAEAMPPGLDVASRIDDYTAADARMVLTQLLDGLPAHHREAITLVWLRGLSIQEAADVLAVPTGTVKSRCGRARTLMAAAVSRGGLITTVLDPD